SGFSRPLTQRISVDLPAPLRPMMPRISPRETESETPLMAAVSPNIRRTSFISTMGADAAGGLSMDTRDSSMSGLDAAGSGLVHSIRLPCLFQKSPYRVANGVFLRFRCSCTLKYTPLRFSKTTIFATARRFLIQTLKEG